MTEGRGKTFVKIGNTFVAAGAGIFGGGVYGYFLYEFSLKLSCLLFISGLLVVGLGLLIGGRIKGWV
jgi:hypothetical protein